MNPWRKFPLLRMLIPFAGGIIGGAGLSQAISFSVLYAILPVIIAAFTVFYLTGRLGYSLRWMPGLILGLCTGILAFGMTLTRLQGTSQLSGAAVNAEEICLAEITEPPVQKEKTTKIIARMIFRGSGRNMTKDDRKALLYIRADERSRSLLYGDRFWFSGTLKEPAPPINPGGYDLRRTCFLKKIALTGFIPSGGWMKAEISRAFSITSFALGIRDRLLRIFRETGLSGREFAVASALLFGYTDEIDGGLFADFSATGTIHILSVSGMHVGVIFIFLEKVLGFMNRFRYGSKARSVLVIAFIWFYAFLTGLSPAVLRAAAMLSFIILGKNLKRNPHILNIIAASAIVLLALDPMLIMDIGFELSYLAVAGIVIFYKPIYDLYITSKWLPDKIWALVAVSVAAQLATFPLSLYEFHRFPNYFMIANIIAVPLSTLIIYLGIILLAFSTVPFLSSFLAMILSWHVKFLNQAVHIMGSLPGSVTSGIYVSPVETILIYGMIVSVFLFLDRKRKSWLFISLVLTIAFTVSLFVSSIRSIGKNEIAVYSVRKYGMAGFNNNRESILVRTGRGEEDPFFSETLKRNMQSQGIRNKFLLSVFPERRAGPAFRQVDDFFLKGHFIWFHDKRIVIVDRKFPSGMCSGMKVDYILLTGNPKVKIKDLVRMFRFDRIIADASNPEFRVNNWKNEAIRLKVRIYSVADSGAFIQD